MGGGSKREKKVKKKRPRSSQSRSSASSDSGSKAESAGKRSERWLMWVLWVLRIRSPRLRGSKRKTLLHLPTRNRSRPTSSDSASESDSGSELEAIPALPSRMLPANPKNATAKTSGRNQGADGRSSQRNSKSKIVRCDICPKFWCRSDDAKALRNHKKSIMHRQNMVLKAGAAYQPAQHRPLYCRVCVMDFADADALMRHRSTDEHKKRVKADRRASFCHLCKSSLRPQRSSRSIWGAKRTRSFWRRARTTGGSKRMLDARRRQRRKMESCTVGGYVEWMFNYCCFYFENIN